MHSCLDRQRGLACNVENVLEGEALEKVDVHVSNQGMSNARARGTSSDKELDDRLEPDFATCHSSGYLSNIVEVDDMDSPQKLHPK